MNEEQYAEMEANEIDKEDSYFAARQRGNDTMHNRKLFEAGFERGYKEGMKEKHGRLLVLATKHCPNDHHDFEEIKQIANDT